MGKSLIIKGADFSENGIRTSNFVEVELKTNGTNPYHVYFLPTPLTYQSNVNTMPDVPGDDVANNFTENGSININSDSYKAFLCGRNTTDSAVIELKSLILNYNKRAITDMNQTLMYVTSDLVDLRGILFGSEVNCNKMFTGSSIIDLKMPDMIVNGGNHMFYNYANGISNINTDFTFIKTLKGSCQQMFKFLKCATANFSNINVSAVTDFSSLFENATLQEIDLSTWIFPHVRMTNLFTGCSNLRTLHLDKWDITADDGVKYYYLFSNCSSLETVYVSECSSSAKTFLIGKLNDATAGGSSNWVESTIDGKAVLVPSA